MNVGEIFHIRTQKCALAVIIVQFLRPILLCYKFTVTHFLPQVVSSPYIQMRISKVALRGYRISSAWLLLIGLKLQMLEREKKEKKNGKRKRKKPKRNCYDKYVDGHCVYCFSLRKCVHTVVDKDLLANLTFYLYQFCRNFQELVCIRSTFRGEVYVMHFSGFSAFIYLFILRKYLNSSSITIVNLL